MKPFSEMTTCELLEDTAAHFNSSNRAVDDYGRCRYRTHDGRGCAIGRLVDSVPVEWEGRMVDSLLPELPPWLQAHGLSFLYALQNLHDRPIHWDANGLSNVGRARVEDLRARYCALDMRTAAVA